MTSDYHKSSGVVNSFVNIGEGDSIDEEDGDNHKQNDFIKLRSSYNVSDRISQDATDELRRSRYEPIESETSGGNESYQEPE